MSDQPKTVRVRIAVAVNHSGEWVADAWKTCHIQERTDADMVAQVLDHMKKYDSSGPAWSVHFIEADVPLPVAQTIQGEVKE